jgi:copper chaperone CopZ
VRADRTPATDTRHVDGDPAHAAPIYTDSRKPPTRLMANSTEHVHDDCCDADAATHERDALRRREGLPPLFGALGGVGAAALSSACCWLPMLLIAIGVSSAGMRGTLDSLRPWLLGVTGFAVALGFYFAYRPRRTHTASDATVAEARPRRRMHVSKTFAWGHALVALLAAFGPEFLTSRASAETVDQEIAALSLNSATATTSAYAVEGMTCGGCAAAARDALLDLPGVAHVDVSFEERRATIIWNEHADDLAVVSALEREGFRSSQLGTDRP